MNVRGEKLDTVRATYLFFFEKQLPSTIDAWYITSITFGAAQEAGIVPLDLARSFSIFQFTLSTYTK